MKPPRSFDPAEDRLLPGIYLPIDYLKILLADDRTLGKNGGRQLGFHTIDRYITSELFVELIRQGWIGTQGVATAALKMLVDEALSERHSVIIAKEWGNPTGAQRRRTVTKRTT